MPYVKQEERGKLDEDIDNMIGAIIKTSKDNVIPDGNVNYVITCIIDRLYGGRTTDYVTLSRAIAVLEAAKLEFYRRKIAPYEDMKKLINGDVYNG